MNNEEGENKLSKDESKMEPSVTEEVETKVEEIEKDTSNPIPPSIGATIVSGEQIQNSHLSTSSENSDTPFLPQENISVEDTKKEEEEEIKKETIKEEKGAEVPEINIVPPQIVIEIPEEDSDEKKLSNSEKLRRTLSTNTLAPKAAKKKRGSLDLKGGEEDDDEEIL